jgi:hypothetical protein
VRFDEIPLPRGPKAMVEGVLLGRALLGQDPADVDRVILLHEAWEAEGLPSDGVTVHVTTRRVGQTVQEDYITADLAGGGRRHGGSRLSAPSGEIHELVLADGAPARDRFRRIHGYLTEELSAAQAVDARGGRHPDPAALRRWAFIDAVARTLTLGPADAAHPTLTAISQDAWPRLSAATAPPALAEIARGLEE